HIPVDGESEGVDASLRIGGEDEQRGRGVRAHGARLRLLAERGGGGGARARPPAPRCVARAPEERGPRAHPAGARSPRIRTPPRVAQNAFAQALPASVSGASFVHVMKSARASAFFPMRMKTRPRAQYASCRLRHAGSGGSTALLSSSTASLRTPFFS